MAVWHFPEVSLAVHRLFAQGLRGIITLCGPLFFSVGRAFQPVLLGRFDLDGSLSLARLNLMFLATYVSQATFPRKQNVRGVYVQSIVLDGVDALDTLCSLQVSLRPFRPHNIRLTFTP